MAESWQTAGRELNRVKEQIKKVQDEIMAAENSLNEVGKKLETANTKQAEELIKERDYLRSKEVALQQQLAELHKTHNLLLELQRRTAEQGQGGTAAGRVPVEFVGVKSEGLRARVYRSQRAATVDGVLDKVDECGAVIIKAPPQSGKTSLLQLLQKAAASGGMYDNVGYISMAGFTEDTSFVKALEQMLPNTWQDFWCPSPTSSLNSSPNQGHPGAGGVSVRQDLLLVDEVQIWYGKKEDPFWGKVKQLQQGNKGLRLRIIMAAMYGSAPSGTQEPPMVQSLPPTPVTFPPEMIVTLQPSADPKQPSLSLSPVEYKELLGSYNEQCSHGGLHDEGLQEGLFKVTAGQVGMVTCVLDLIQSKVRNASDELGLVEKVARYVLRHESLYVALGEQRSFIQLGLLNRYKKVLEVVLSGDKMPDDEMAAAQQLARTGLLVNEGGDQTFTFASPLHENYYLVQVYRGRLLTVEDTSADFDTFIKRSIERMSSEQLHGSLSRGASEDARVYERHYQMEWYKSAAGLLPKSISIAPDVGAVFGSSGLLDFYVRLSPEVGWGIELLCNGDRASEHSARFGTEGRYACVPMTAHALIDFREAGKGRPLVAPLPKFYHVTFEDDFKKATIVTAGKDPCTVHLSQ